MVCLYVCKPVRHNWEAGGGTCDTVMRAMRSTFLDAANKVIKAAVAAAAAATTSVTRRPQVCPECKQRAPQPGLLEQANWCSGQLVLSPKPTGLNPCWLPQPTPPVSATDHTLGIVTAAAPSTHHWFCCCRCLQTVDLLTALVYAHLSLLSHWLQAHRRLAPLPLPTQTLLLSIPANASARLNRLR